MFRKQFLDTNSLFNGLERLNQRYGYVVPDDLAIISFCAYGKVKKASVLFF